MQRILGRACWQVNAAKDGRKVRSSVAPGAVVRLIASLLCLGSNHADLPDAGGEDSISEFQAKPKSCNDVLFDCTSTPSATVDVNLLG